MLKVTKNHEIIAKIGPNGVIGLFLDVFVILMTKKCTKTIIFATSSVKSQGRLQPLLPEI
jgi:hypothetical protein